MKCPNCEHISDDKVLVKCSHCGETFERGLIEELAHLDYMQTWTKNHETQLGTRAIDFIQKYAFTRKAELLKILRPPKEEIPAPQPKPEVTPAPQPVVEPVAPPAPVLEAKPQAAAVVVSKPVPAPKPQVTKPVAPPKPQRPPVDWNKIRTQISDAATSGALLRALLYLGAFMIVVSATVLVIRFWDNFSLVIQLLFIAAVPVSFYAGGWTLRTRLKLSQAGSVLTGIGAILVAVDFYAVFQLGGLASRVNGPVYWLIVAIFCTGLYAFTAWRLHGEFFDYLTLLAGVGVAVAISRVLHTPLEWTVLSVTLSAFVMTILAGQVVRRGDAWKGFGRASRYLSQILIPASLFYIIFSPAKPPVGQMTAFLAGMLGYIALAWYFPSIVFAYAGLGASIGTVIYGAQVFELPIEWYPTVASILALAYLMIGQFLRGNKSDSNILKNYVRALNTSGLALIGLALLGGYAAAFFAKTWEAVSALTLASFDLAICAFLFRKARYSALASLLFVVPFTLGFARWFSDLNLAQPVGWMTVAWVGLGLLYVCAGAILRKSEAHADWLFLWAHTITLAALAALPLDFLFTWDKWQNTPALISLGLAFSVHVLSLILQDSGKHASLAKISNWLPYGLGKSIFLWLPVSIVPLWIAVAWYGSDLPRPWLGTVLAVLGIAYIGVGQQLHKRTKEYRLPIHLFVYVLCIAGIVASVPDPHSFSLAERYPLLISILIATASAGLLAYIYNRLIETTLGSILFVWAFALSLMVFRMPAEAHGLAYVLLGAIAYIPVAIYLNRFQKSREQFHPIPIFIIGYSLSVYAIVYSLFPGLPGSNNPWFAAIVPIVATALYVFSASYFRLEAFSASWAWASALSLAITFRQFLTLVNLPPKYDALAWVCLAAIYVIVERLLARTRIDARRYWFEKFHLPAVLGAVALSLLSLGLVWHGTLAAFRGINLKDYQSVILAEIALVLLGIAASRLYQRNWTLYLTPFLSFLPVTLFFIGYGEQLFGRELTTPQYALAWTGLGIIHFLAAIFTDRAKIRYSNPLYLGAYMLLTWSVLWSLIERTTLAWTLGIWILAAITSALLVHFSRHQTWADFTSLTFGKSASVSRTHAKNLFQWLAAWAFPVWCVLLLLELNVSSSFAWLGLVVSALAYLGIALWLRGVQSTYTMPWHSTAQFYTALALLITAPLTIQYLFDVHTLNDASELLAFRILQALAVIFYAASAAVFKSRGFAHGSAWLSIIPFTLSWKIYSITFTPLLLVIPWLAWATVLLVIGFALDKNKTRYSHGPYLAGYVLAIFALIHSTPDRLTNIYALGITIPLVLVSYLVVHYGRHTSFEDFVNFFFKKADETARGIIATIFLFFACYATPVLLTQYLAYIEYPLPWRGVTLALAAPLYLAIGLAVRNAKSRGIATVPTWALYSSSYALTAIGAMISFGDERLAIYVLILDAVVYAFSAYIFRQTFWLYLSNVLAPVIALLILHNSGQLKAEWVAWIFMGIAIVYLAIGQVFERGNRIKEQIHPFAVPFYAPAFVLSAIALAASSSDRVLALQVYTVAAIFYALCGWLFGETLFIYPAAWLAAVPYYLAVTLTSLETRWYGLAWLPLIILYIGLGRFVFHKRPLARLGTGVLVDWLSHPAMSFYLLAYALSVSMISLSYVNPLSITIAFGIATILYGTSTWLFRTPAWLYAGLFTAHMTLLTYFTIDPKGGGAHLLSIPFMALAWIMSLLGYGFSRWFTQAYTDDAFRWSITKRLFSHPWSRPFFAFAVFDILFWQTIALYGYDTTIIVASGFALLLALFSFLWAEGGLVYGVVGFGILALGAWMKQSDFALPDAFAVYGGVGFGLYLLSLILEWTSSRVKPLTVWLKPLTHCAVFLTADAAIINMALIFDHISAAAATLAFAGALYVTIAYRGRQYILGYLGMALLEASWAMLLIINDVTQPQWYAIPAGLYFIAVSYFEWKRNRKRYAVGIEILGLGVLLLTSFTQSLNGAKGFPYFVLLMLEALLVILWGVLQRRKIPFFTGIGASALNLLAQVIVLVNVYDINIWLVALGVGLFIMGIAVLVEFKREQLRARSQELSEALEKWE